MRDLPAEVRLQAGYELYRVQQGRKPVDWRPMPSGGAGVAEIRVHGELEHRVLYVARHEEAVYVLHVFEKKGRKTPSWDLQIGRTRYRELIQLRSRYRKG
jgi:phage-related protein